MTTITLSELYQGMYDRKMAQLVELNTVYTGFLTGGGVQSYTLVTGQTTQTVTKVNAFLLVGQIARLEAELEALINRISGSGATFVARPGF
jgi:hypothetical protein